MNIIELLNFINESSNDIKIYYSYINGESKFFINGVNIFAKEFYDDSEIKNEIKKYKSVIDDLDDCLFLDVIEDIKSMIDIKTFDELLEQDSYTEDEEEIVSHMISLTKTVINEHVQNRISDYQDILKRL